MALTHAFVSTKPDGDDATRLQPSNWNADHVLAMQGDLGWYDVTAYGATGDGTTDDTAAIQAAITAAGTGGTTVLPPGTYRTTASLTTPAGGCRIVGPGTVTYTGTGNAIALGAAGASAVDHGLYDVSGVRFAHCAAAAAVLYCSPWAANVWIHGNVFHDNAGNADGVFRADILTSSNNWSVRVEGNYLHNLLGVAGGHGIVSTDDVSTHLLVRGNTITGASAGTAIRVAGGGSVIAGNKLEGYYTAIELGGSHGATPQTAAHSIAIVDNYFEAGSTSQPVISYHGFVGAARILGNYCNVHNSALPGALFVGPMTADDRLGNSVIAYNAVADCSTVLVTFNADAAQSGMVATGNVAYDGTALTVSNHLEYFA